MHCLTNATDICSANDFGAQILLYLLNTLLISQKSLKPEYPPDRALNHLPEYDFIVVGAGSAGSALTATLASNPKWNVLLIEAGDDPKLNSEIPLLFPSIQNTPQDWQYLTEPQERACLALKNRQCAWPRGKMLGGTSAINAMVYNMGNPRDYDEWEQMGNAGWGWKDVEKYFKNQMDKTLKPKPFLEEQGMKDILEETRQALIDAGKELGFENIQDPYEKSQGIVGYYEILGTVEGGQRLSAARAYLVPIAKQENLHVIKNGHVTKVLIDKTTKQVQGVQVFLNNEFVEIRAAKEVILSAGTINTPQILMLSGIGPEKHLQSLNIDPIQNLPVEDHLMDHVNIMIPLMIHQQDNLKMDLVDTDSIYNYFMKREGPLRTTALASMVTYLNPKDPKSKIGEISFHYLYVSKNDQTIFLNQLNMDDQLLQFIVKANQKSPLVFVYINLLRPKSEGTLRLKTNDPFTPPIIDPNYHEKFEDIEMLLHGYRHLQKLLTTDAMKSMQAEMIRFEFDACKQYEYDSDDFCICLIKQLTSTVYHPVGTARMGIGDDSVVDTRLRVKGVQGLRVADGSIMPKIVGGNTNAPIIMIGEKVGDLIKDDWLNRKHSEL